MDPNQQPNPNTKRIKVSVYLIVIFIAVIITVGIIWMKTKDVSTGPTTTPVSTPQTVDTDTVPDIKSDKDLEKLENEVKNTDIDGLSKDLDANDADSKDY